MRQRKLVADLEDGIVQLREEIQELKLQRELIGRAPLATSNVWGVAVEFFRLFRFGVQPSTISSRTPRRSDYNAQRDFMLSTMMPGVTDGDVSGVDALLENWALQSLCLDEIDLQPVRMEKESGDSLFANTEGPLFINENTIQYAFPHLVGEEEQSSVLVSKMLGQTLVLRGSVFFEWDSTSNRVAGVYCRVDILTPLAHLLGSLEEASYVFGKARITPEGRLVSKEAF
ncbi:uncharacterized protein IUM83_06267 [Phytophthora cinnamomi]|uniref:uncharacterized protein n=1 Tax=Phytophthora cinnamomi TaxID=4785 RepID=UPI003559CFAD|nr:hypothetical protein IUM83_06267 [Phytophthora cinnamomi]